MSAERHRALRLLAGAPLGATEAIMLAHGFTYTTLDTLVRDGLATAEQREVRAGRRPIKVIWLTITDIGRLALAGWSLGLPAPPGRAARIPRQQAPARPGLGRISGAASAPYRAAGASSSRRNSASVLATRHFSSVSPLMAKSKIIDATRFLAQPPPWVGRRSWAQTTSKAPSIP
jgi:hypothetical protein